MDKVHQAKYTFISCFFFFFLEVIMQSKTFGSIIE